MCHIVVLKPAIKVAYILLDLDIPLSFHPHSPISLYTYSSVKILLQLKPDDANKEKRSATTGDDGLDNDPLLSNKEARAKKHGSRTNNG